VALGHRLLRAFLRGYPLPYGKGLACRAAYWAFGPAEVRTGFGMRMQVNPAEVIGRQILCTGWWEPEISALVRELLSPGDVVLDVGANVGYFTFLASKLVGKTGKVFAFEPDPWSRAVLAGQLRLNAIENVDVLPFGLAEANAEATLYHGRPKNPGETSLRPMPNARATAIELRRGDELVPRELWPSVKLVKMDVEGAELRALRGLSGLIEGGAAENVLIEVTPGFLTEMGDSEAQLLDFLHERGYTMRKITEAPPDQVWQYDAWFSRGRRAAA
jgi:FkbM family methyltransferase